MEPAISRAMQDNIDLWYSMYVNNPPWAGPDIIPLGLPAAIAREMARPALVEFTGTVTGGARGKFLDECFQTATRDFERALELGLALGGVALKPYIYNGKVRVDATSVAAFQPTKFDAAGKCVAGVFREKIKSGKKWYIRLENHEFRIAEDGRGYYTVQNTARESNEAGTAGPLVPLDTVPEWTGLDEEVEIWDVERPLFAYFKPPQGNNVDMDSNMGVSVYGGAVVGLIKDADDQWERIWWEFKSGERKVFVDAIGESGVKLMRNRLYETGPFGEGVFKEFSPAFRDDALYRGFQNILKQVEFQTGLAYGTISDPQSIEKTATEILASKHRQHVTERHIQDAWGDCLDDLVYAMNVYTSLYGLAPDGDYEFTMSFGDGILDDPESRRADMAIGMSEVSAGLLDPVKYRMIYHKETEEEAKANLPGMDFLVTEEQQVIE